MRSSSHPIFLAIVGAIHDSPVPGQAVRPDPHHQRITLRCIVVLTASQRLNLKGAPGETGHGSTPPSMNPPSMRLSPPFSTGFEALSKLPRRNIHPVR